MSRSARVCGKKNEYLDTCCTEHCQFMTWWLSNLLYLQGILQSAQLNLNLNSHPKVLIHYFSKFPDQVSTFADSLNFWTCMVNIVNGTMSIGIVIFWCFTIVGSRSSWMKLRLVSCASLLASIFLVLAAVIFSTFFDQLVILEKDRGT